MYGLYEACQFQVFTDSRNVVSGGLFIAIKGDKFDANVFVEAVLNAGAGGVITSDKHWENHPKCFYVDDTTWALQELAREHRKRLKIPVIGIAGSNGKTTTKELVTAVLKQRFIVHATRGNFNNHIGLPLTILSAPADTEMLVLEMGSNHPGELAVLCDIGSPTSGLITSLGKEHLEGFGSFEAVVEEEGALFDFLNKSNGTKFVLADDLLLKNRSGKETNAFFYGTSNDLDVIGKFIAADPTVRFQWSFSFPPDENDPEIKSQLIGHYNFYNLLAAACVGKYYGVNFNSIAAALKDYTPANNRSQFIEKFGSNILLDAYNANPSSMELAIDNFEKNINSSHKIAILGDMFELGSYEEEEHIALIEKLKRCSFTEIWLVGSAFEKQHSIFGSNMKSFKTVTELREAKSLENYPNYWFLLKGSRGVALEKFLD